jgi:replicative DNA helicase
MSVVKFGKMQAMVPVARDGMQPPHDLDAEAAVIAACMNDEVGSKALKRLGGMLKHEHFYSEAHRRIFESILSLYESGHETGIITVSSDLKARGRLEQVGGMIYLTEVSNASPSHDAVRDHAMCVFDMWRRREAIVMCQKLEAHLYVGDVSTSNLQSFLDTSAREFLDLANKNPRSSGEDLLVVMKRVLEAGALVSKRHASGEEQKPMATTSIDALDDHIGGGMLGGKKYTIAARPGRGKSVLGLQLCRVNAKRGVGAAMFATEQNADELAVRLLAATAEIDSRRVQAFTHRPTLNPDEWRRITEAGRDNAKLPLVLDSNPNMTVDDVCAKATTLAHTFEARFGVKLGVIVVDYLQRLARPKHFGQDVTKDKVFSYSTMRLKSLAQELGIAVVELAQQKMAQDKSGKEMKPTERMVDWCPDAERESDAVVYLWERGNCDHVGVVTKVREGGFTGEFPFDFDKPHSRMSG